jgi:hypothetical protein
MKIYNKKHCLKILNKTKTNDLDRSLNMDIKEVKLNSNTEKSINNLRTRLLNMQKSELVEVIVSLVERDLKQAELNKLPHPKDIPRNWGN